MSQSSNLNPDDFIRWYDLDVLQYYDRNYREGDVGQIILSIRQFGFNGVIRGVWNNMVMAGNHQLNALRQMKAKAEQLPRGLRLNGKTGMWQVRGFDISHLSRIQAEAFAVADNRTQQLGTNDPNRLALILQDIAATKDETLLLSTGYDGNAIDFMLQGIQGDFLDAPRDNSNFRVVDADAGKLSLMTWRDIMVTLPVPLYLTVAEYVALDEHPDRAAAMINLLTAGLAAYGYEIQAPEENDA